MHPKFNAHSFSVSFSISYTVYSQLKTIRFSTVKYWENYVFNYGIFSAFCSAKQTFLWSARGIDSSLATCGQMDGVPSVGLRRQIFEPKKGTQYFPEISKVESYSTSPHNLPFRVRENGKLWGDRQVIG